MGIYQKIMINVQNIKKIKLFITKFKNLNDNRSDV